MTNVVWVLLAETFGNIKKSECFIFKDRNTAFDMLETKITEYENAGKSIRKRRNSSNTNWMIGDDMILSCYPSISG